jgi:hypothetical protein
MVAASRQIALGGLNRDDEEQAEVEAGYIWREQLWSTMRQFVSSYMSGGLKGYDACAAELDRRWGAKGRPVSASALRSALHDVERNNFRAEWLDWFAARSQEVADLMARRVKPAKTAEERLADLEAEMREELSHKRAEAVLRRARSR